MIVYGQVTLSNSVTFADITCEGMTFDNDDTIGVVVVSTLSTVSNSITITRGSSANGIGEGKFRITFNEDISPPGIVHTYYAFRY